MKSFFMGLVKGLEHQCESKRKNKAKKFAKQQASEVYQCKAPRFANTKFYYILFPTKLSCHLGASIQNYSKSQVCLDEDLLAIISHKVVVPFGCIHPKNFKSQVCFNKDILATILTLVLSAGQTLLVFILIGIGALTAILVFALELIFRRCNLQVKPTKLFIIFPNFSSFIFFIFRLMFWLTLTR